jgi:hypothetical protein
MRFAKQLRGHERAWTVGQTLAGALQRLRFLAAKAYVLFARVVLPGSTQREWPFPEGAEETGYAYILTHPGQCLWEVAATPVLRPSMSLELPSALAVVSSLGETGQKDP